MFCTCSAYFTQCSCSASGAAPPVLPPAARIPALDDRALLPGFHIGMRRAECYEFALRAAQVYVGNLMPGLVTGDMLRQLFNSTMAAAFPDKIVAGEKDGAL